MNAKNQEFAAWLKSGLEARGWKPADLARTLDIQQSTITRWLQGSLPHKHTLGRIERALRRPYDPPRPEPAGELHREPTTTDDHERYLTADIPADMRFDLELEGFTMGELIRMVRLLTLSTYEKPVILNKLFRQMEKLEAAAAK